MEVEVVASTAAHALTHLSALCLHGSDDGELDGLLRTIGDTTGETWAHLYGWCVPPDGDADLADFRERVAAVDPRTFRSTILGATAWSWVHVVGADVIDAAVDGDRSAAARLREDDRFYAGNAADALGTVLRWDSERTKQAFVAALDRYVEVHGESAAATVHELSALAASVAPDVDGVASLTGYRYFPEPEAERVVLLLHGFDRSLSLAQHDGIRLIVHGRLIEPDATVRLTVLAGALADENRVRLLAQIAAEQPTALGPLMERTGLARSTIHHHLAILRDAGLVAVEGNARAYRYLIHPDAATDWSAALAAVTSADGSRGGTR